MHIQQPNNELLIKYLLNEVNAEENAFVTEWLAADDNNLQYFQAFEKLWLLTRFTDSNNINIDAEWEVLKERMAKSVSEPVQTSQATVHLLKNQSSIGKRKINKFITAVAVAASVIAIIFLGKFLFTNQPIRNNLKAMSNKPKDSVALVLRHEINTTGKQKKIQLQDGSTVLLEDKSELIFNESFAASYRSITLIGKANFKVAKDKTRPFTVFSDAVATTVLGTVFDVSAYPQATTISIKLYEGKVVVNAAPSSAKKLKDAVFLSPGYEMVYNKQTALADVRPFNVTKKDTISNQITPVAIEKLNVPGKKGSWFMFNNQPLNQVLNQLQDMYKVEIQYSEKDVQKLYFIGQFNREDSIETILEQIAKSNSLSVTKTNNIFIIHK
jgi:transmembrane sensor